MKFHLQFFFIPNRLMLMCFLLITLSFCTKSNNQNSSVSVPIPAPTPVPAPTNNFAKGADITWITEMEAAGKKFYNHNQNSVYIAVK